MTIGAFFHARIAARFFGRWKQEGTEEAEAGKGDRESCEAREK